MSRDLTPDWEQIEQVTKFFEKQCDRPESDFRLINDYYEDYLADADYPLCGPRSFRRTAQHIGVALFKPTSGEFAKRWITNGQLNWTGNPPKSIYRPEPTRDLTPDDEQIKQVKEFFEKHSDTQSHGPELLNDYFQAYEARTSLPLCGPRSFRRTAQHIGIKLSKPTRGRFAKLWVVTGRVLIE